MEEKKCVNCGQHNNCKDAHTSGVFVAIGMIATVLIRTVTVLMHFSPIYGVIAWYAGVIGFLIFFIYKFKISQARARFIIQKSLIDKIANRKQLAEDDYGSVKELLCGLVSKKERINYLFIFILSAAALLVAIYMDFFK